MQYKHDEISPDGLVRETWIFGVTKTHRAIYAYIESYTVHERPTKRHGFKHVLRCYQRLNHRDSSVKDIKDVPLPIPVATIVERFLRQSIWVTKEYPR